MTLKAHRGRCAHCGHDHDAARKMAEYRAMAPSLASQATTTPNAPKAAAPAVAEAINDDLSKLRFVSRVLGNFAQAPQSDRADAYAMVRELIESTWQRGADLAAAPQQVAAWMSIETAPKYKEVLLWREDAGSFTGIFTSAEQFLSDRDQAQLTIEELEVEDWFGGDYRGSWRLDGDEKPTHWQPLPAPPSQASATGEV